MVKLGFGGLNRTRVPRVLIIFFHTKDLRQGSNRAEANKTELRSWFRLVARPDQEETQEEVRGPKGVHLNGGVGRFFSWEKLPKENVESLWPVLSCQI